MTQIMLQNFADFPNTDLPLHECFVVRNDDTSSFPQAFAMAQAHQLLIIPSLYPISII